tara:strand:+ start:1252 stop:1494 length:243 start_codon:yes stop_codon:yes gene_type:complete
MSIAKGKVQNLVDKQGGELYIRYDGHDDLEIEVILPEGLVWDNGSNRGVCTVTQDVNESISAVWSYVWREINWPVVKTSV